MVYFLLFVLIVFHLGHSRQMQRIYKIEKRGLDSMERQQTKLQHLQETSTTLRQEINALECRMAHVEEDLKQITPPPYQRED